MPRPAVLLLLTIARARVLELDAEELEPLRRTSQLPAAGASDLIAEDFASALLLLLLFGMLTVTLMLKRAAAKKSLDLLWI